MEYKITYYKDGKLNIGKTIRSHIAWHIKHYLKQLKGRIMEVCELNETKAAGTQVE